MSLWLSKLFSRMTVIDYVVGLNICIYICKLLNKHIPVSTVAWYFFKVLIYLSRYPSGKKRCWIPFPEDREHPAPQSLLAHLLLLHAAIRVTASLKSFPIKTWGIILEKQSNSQGLISDKTQDGLHSCIYLLVKTNKYPRFSWVLSFPT